MAAVCAAYLHAQHDTQPLSALAGAVAAGLSVTPAACALLGVDFEEVRARAEVLT